MLMTLCCMASWGAMAQEGEKKEEKSEGFEFTVIKENPITSIKNQNKSGTCWCFSTLSFIESELLRMGKGEHDLCEMFVVHKTMEDRARQAVRTLLSVPVRGKEGTVRLLPLIYIIMYRKKVLTYLACQLAFV